MDAAHHRLRLDLLFEVKERRGRSGRSRDYILGRYEIKLKRNRKS